jgi:beta-lactamase regulating signal transducer with metallopeptidase domain
LNAITENGNSTPRMPNMPGLELWTTALLLDISIKAALLATAAWIGMALFRVRSSHLQHRVWLLVLAGMLLLPALVHLAPSISLPHWLYPDLQLTAANVEPDPVIAIPLVLGLQIEPQQINPVPFAPPSFEPTLMPEVTPSAPPPLVGTDLTGTAPAPVAVPEAVVPLSIPLAVVLPETQAETRPNSAALVVLAIYLVGLAIQTTRLVIGMVWTLRLSHHARPIETPLARTWLPHWAALAESTELRVPVTVGYWRPVVMLPTDWTTWSEEFLSMVLAHETEHVRRRDTWAALLAALNTAVFWFHPAAWLVRRRLTDLAEQICDDEVIRITGSRGDYAQNLLEMAGRLTSDPRRLAPVGVAMARKASVVKRIEAIIDRDRPLSRRIGTLAALLLLTTIVPLVFLAAGLRATDPSQAAEADPIAEKPAEKNADPDDSDTEPSAATAAPQDNGSKFVYVLDRSLNMKGAEHSPLEAAQAELIASLDSLEETHQFRIVFYNETPKAFNPSGQQGELALATEQNKLRARRFVESITPLGQAEHESALKLAIRTQPDVVFFLTAASDSPLSDRQLYEIQRQAAGIQINTIEFGDGPKQGGDNFLNKLARQNGGQYAYRDITKSADNAAKPNSSPKGLKGRVVLASDEPPVAGAEVRLLTAKRTTTDRKETTTNEQGEFEFNQLVEGQKILLAFHKDLASRTKMFQGHVAEDGDHDILLKLREAPPLKVKVVTRDEGKPIEDATVRLSWTDTKQEYRTDANGEALIQGLTSEMWRIESRAKDFAVDARRVQLSRTGVSNVTVELEPGAELYGVVRDENGTPLPKASVSVHRNEQSNHSITDSEGKYRVQHLPIAGLRVSGLKEGYLTAHSDVTLTVPPGGEQELNLTLTRRPDGGSVQGVVTDADGNPVEAVSVSNPGPVVPRDARETTTDARGYYRLDNVFEANGTHTLRVAAKGFATQRFEFAPGTREDPAQVNVTLEAGHRIRGRVIDEQGQPLSSVQAKWHDPSLSGFPWRNSVLTDKEGRFALDSLPTYPTFQFRKDGYSEIRQARLSLDGEDEVVITMQSEGVIRGRVVDAETGNAVSPFTIRVDSTLDRKPGDVSGGLNENRMAGIEMVPDEDGTFFMGNFVRGSFWRLTIEADGYDPLFVPRIGVATESDVETVEFQLTPFDDSQLLTLAGRLENEQGQPITGAEFRLIVATDRPDPPHSRDASPFDWVSIRYDDGPRNGEAVLQFFKATTDGEGRFTFDRVRPADDLELVYWGTGASKQRIIFKQTRTDDDGAPRYERIAKDEEEQGTQYSAEALQGLTITTKTPGIIRGSIDRAALPDLRVICLTAADGDIQGTTISPSKDSYEIHNVAPGKYTLHVDEPRARQPRPAYAAQPGNALDGGPVEKGIPIEVKPGETVTVDLDSESPVHLKPRVPPPSATYYGYTNGPLPPAYAPEPASQSKQPLPTPWNGATTAPPHPDATNKASSQDPSTSIPAIFTGRRPPRKQSLLQLNGGNAATTEAVNAGLQWLARNQQEDGSWSLTGPYADGGRQENREAATAMALLAFQGDGNTADHGEHQSVVKRGWQYLLKQQDSDGCFFRNGSFGHRFYTHGQATIAICELFAMTEDPELRRSYKEPAEKAITYCVKSQSPLGGWKYAPQVSADLSVTGWILVALQTARIAGLDVPDETLAGITKHLDQIAQHGGSRYPYQKGREVTRAMTAEGLLCRQYLGWRPTHPELREGVEWLLRPENQISYADERDVYYWYYATQVMYHMGGEPWQKWNHVMGQELPAQQSRHETDAGSWDPAKPSRDEWGGEGGRLFVTCLSICMLEAYYRHSPIYAEAEPTESSPTTER